MLYTTGVSFTLEFGLKAAYEESLGRLATLIRGPVPNCTTVALTVAWFGNDLRCANCTVRPKVDAAVKSTFRNGVAPNWTVGSVTRGTATLVSTTTAGQLAYGGTPSDASVVAAITDLKARSFEVLLHPLVLMDVPAGNTLPNPYSANAAGVGQAAYPSRAKITCSPAPGFAGTVDQTVAAATQINTFFTQANGYNAFILHLANLAVQAGGVDAFLIGSELVGLTKIRNASDTFTAVTNLQSQAASVRAVVGVGTKISYAADWTEFSNYRPEDGTALGCPAIDKGANQPSAVLDAKSAETALPWHSNGARDDAMQRAVLEAHLAFWSGDAMVARSLVWGWNARPGPIRMPNGRIRRPVSAATGFRVGWAPPRPRKPLRMSSPGRGSLPMRSSRWSLSSMQLWRAMSQARGPSSRRWLRCTICRRSRRVPPCGSTQWRDSRRGPRSIPKT